MRQAQFPFFFFQQNVLLIHNESAENRHFFFCFLPKILKEIERGMISLAAAGFVTPTGFRPISMWFNMFGQKVFTMGRVSWRSWVTGNPWGGQGTSSTPPSSSPWTKSAYVQQIELVYSIDVLDNYYNDMMWS